MSELIAIEGVGKRYVTASGPVQALRDVSHAVREGEFCTIIGPSGCGKSTLLGMVGGLVTPDAGRVLVDGAAVAGPDPRRVALVFQDPGLFPWRTTLENIEFGLPERRGDFVLDDFNPMAGTDNDIAILDVADFPAVQADGSIKF